MAEQDQEDYYVVSEVNEAKGLSKDELTRISVEIKDGFDEDFETTQDMRNSMERYRGLIEKESEQKSSPWTGACGVQLPNIATAIINFASRASLNLFRNNTNPTRAYSINPELRGAAQRVQKYFNNHITHHTDFYTSYEKTLNVLARDGCYFRKVFWDNGPQSELILPEDFVISYNSRSLKGSARYSQILHFTQNDIEIRIKKGLWLKPEVMPTPSTTDNNDLNDTSMQNRGISKVSQGDDYASLIDVVECHTTLKLKGDECRKPRIITFNRATGDIYRITPRWSDEKGYIPITYFVTTSFVKNPNSVYGYGFGHLFYSTQKVMNSIIRQIIDVQSLSISPPIIISKRSGLSGNIDTSPGAVTTIDGRVDDIAKNIYRFNFDAPSQVLYNSLGFLANKMDQFTSVTEAATGAMPRSDTTATAAELAVEMSSKLFTAMQRSVHLTITKEFGLMKDLMAIYLLEDDYFKTIEEYYEDVIAEEDIRAISRVELISDPNVASEKQVVAKAEFLASVIKDNPFLAESPAAQKISLRSRLAAVGEDESTIQALENEIDIKVQEQEQAEQEAAAQAQQQMQSEATIDQASQEYDKQVEEGQTREDAVSKEYDQMQKQGGEVGNART